MRRRFSRLAQLLTLTLAAGAILTYAGAAPAETAPTYSATGFQYIKALNAAPTANAAVNPKTVGTGQTATFDATGSFDDAQPASELTYEWTFGDGTSAKGAKVTHAYAAKGAYTATLRVTDAQGLSGTTTLPVTVVGPDLQVTNITVAEGKVPSNGLVKVTATLTNVGPGDAPASTTQFLYDGFRVLGDIATPAIPKGQSVQVSVMWNASGVKGEHSLRATADKPATIGEEAEGNNTAHRLVTVTGGRVVQGTFAQN